MKKIVLSIIFFLFLFGFILKNQTFAVTDTSGDLQVTYDDPLFPSSIVWYPGLSVTKTITVKNTGSSTHTTSIKADNTSQTGNIDQLYLFKITEGSTSWYGGSNDKTLKNFWDAGELHLSDISSGNSTTYDITITMPSSAGNEYQDKTAKFDLIIGFVGTNETVTVSGGGGTVSGVSTSAVCNDQKPGSAPILFSSVPGTNSVTLNWSKASEPVSYYLVAYGISPNNNTYGNPNVGNKDTTSYTVNNLSGGTVYCFIVRSGNGCTPGDFSNQVCATPAGGTVTGVATGFGPGVLGVSTPEAKLVTSTSQNGQIKGSETTVRVCKDCIWWQLMLVEGVVLFLYYYLLINKRRFTHPMIPALIIPVITYGAFLSLNGNCRISFLFLRSFSVYCTYFWLIDITTYLIITLIYRKRSN